MAFVGITGWISAMGYPEYELDAGCVLLSVLASVASYYFAQVSVNAAGATNMFTSNRLRCLTC